MIRTVTTIRKVCIRLVLLVALAGLLADSGTALSAQDVVEVRSEKTGNILKRRGEIKSWEGASLTLEANGRSDSIPNDT
ncbi:MAG: hypothetical protein ACKO0N_03100, partial [Planctomycetota bacterium]